MAARDLDLDADAATVSPSSAGSPAGLVAEFTRCLNTMSHSRAGWDYQLSREQRQREDQQERGALARVRTIWSENSGLHDVLREAFAAAKPLASMSEIERGQ